MTYAIEDHRSMLTPASRFAPRADSRTESATLMIVLAFLVALVPLVFIVGYVIQRGSEIFGWDFLTKPPPFSERLPGPGDGPGGRRDAPDHRRRGADGDSARDTRRHLPQRVRAEEPARGFVRFLSEVMTGVPSIVMGLFIYTFVVLRTHEKNGFAGALALACLMLPIMIRTTDQMLSLVPSELREGSYALGSRRARTIRTVVLAERGGRDRQRGADRGRRRRGRDGTVALHGRPGRGPRQLEPLQRHQLHAVVGDLLERRSLFPTAQDRAWGARSRSFSSCSCSRFWPGS